MATKQPPLTQRVEDARERLQIAKKQRADIAARRRDRAQVQAYFDASISAFEQTGERALALAVQQCAHGHAVEVFTTRVECGEVTLGPLLAAVAGRLMREALQVHIDALAPSVASATRATTIEECDRQIFAIETQEETLIRTSEAEGAAIERRTDANPAVVLAPHEALRK